MNLFTIELQNGGQLYSLFYFLAFFTGLIILVIEGRQRKYPVIPWLLVISTSFLFFMVGTQVVKFSGQDWQRVWQFKELEGTPGRSVLGGILLVVPGLLLAKYLLKFKYSLLDAFAWTLPIGMTVQRLGCLLAGCCFGAPTSVPWGIQYGNTSHAFHQHVQENIIPASSSLSLVIHPIALYEIIGCLLAMLALNRLRKYLTVPGNLFLASLGSYLLVRFVTEFFRANTWGEKLPDGLTIIQLGILIVLQLIVFLILLRERKLKNYSVPAEKPLSDKYALVYFLGLALLFSIVSKWLTSLEIFTLNLVMLPTLVFIGWHLFKSITVPTMRLNTIALMIGSLIMMSQTLPEKANSDSTKFSYHIFSIGTLTSNGEFELKESDCNGPTNVYVMKQDVKVYGAGYTRVEQRKYGEVLQYGIDGYWGSHTETVKGVESNYVPIVGIHPYFQYDWKLFGMGAGLHVGTLSQFSTSQYDGSTVTPTSVKEMHAFPSAYFRVGYLDRVFGELKLGQQFPSPFPSLSFQTLLGIGFKNNYGGAFRIGTASHAGLVLAPTFPLGKHVILEPLLAGFPGFLFKSELNDYGYDFKQKSSFTGSISLRYKFGRSLRRVN